MANKLPPHLEAELVMLRNELDRKMTDWCSSHRQKNAEIEYFYAKERLKKFVKARREEGYNL